MKIRLVHVTTSPLFLGFLRGQIKFIRARGIETSVISSPGKLLDDFAQNEQVPCFGVTMHRRITPWHDLVALARLYLLLRRIQPHIVHAHTPKGGLLGTAAAWLSRVPVRIYHVRGLPHLTVHGVKRILLHWSEKTACTLAHQVLCVSHSIRQIAIEEALCPPDKIKVLAQGSGQGVDADAHFNPFRFSDAEKHNLRQQLNIPRDGQVIGFVGRLVRDKGIVELTRAWVNLRDRYPNLYLLLVGDYEAQDPVPLEVQKQLLDDPRVRITGWVPDTAPYYSIIQILLLPSYREGFPNTPLEAAAMQVPTIASDIPGCKDAVENEKTGLLIPPNDASALETAVRRYLDNPEMRQQHGQAGRERVLRFFKQEILWEAQYEEYMRLLRERGIVPAQETEPCDHLS